MAKKTDERRWYYQPMDCEQWYGGAKTRDVAIQDALSDELCAGPPFRVAFGIKRPGAHFVPMVARVIDVMWQDAESAFGKQADGFPHLSESAVDELDRMLKRWAEKHVTQSFWDMGTVEKIVGMGG